MIHVVNIFNIPSRYDIIYKRNINKEGLMLRKITKFIKLVLFALLLVLGLILLYDRFFVYKEIAIVHNHQNINPIKITLSDNRTTINDIDTSRMDIEMCKRKIERVDGVIFAGGNDFDPEIYGGDRKLVEEYSREDDEKSLAILDYAIGLEKPILGICRGMQLINIYYGGSLYDDLEKQFSKEIIHRGSDKTLTYHEINISEGTSLSKIAHSDRIEVNSYHHEGIKDLAEGLSVSATSDDGLIEAIENPYYPYMLGVQWHPELSYENDKYSKKILKDFVKHSNAGKN